MTSRRDFIKVLAASAAAGLYSRDSRSQDACAPPPNIVLIYADDMGYGDLAIQNPESRIPTPFLDELAREGMRFTDAHSSSGICTPSRYALLTGGYHWRKFHGIVNSFDGPVFDDELTLAQLLQDAGYRTACIGKWHLGWDWEAIRVGPRSDEKTDARPADYDWSQPIPGGPTAHGFDYYFGDDVPNFPPYTWMEMDRVLTPPTELYAPEPVPEEGGHEGRPGPMAPGWRLDAVMPRLTEKAVSFIADQKGADQPFFLYFPWTSPHTPIVPAPEFKGKTEAGPYGDFVYQSDWSTGQVLKALDDHGFRENTLVIFTSDNGPEHYAYARIRNHGHRSMGPLRGLKRDIFEGGHRVPMIMRLPGAIPAGSVCDQLVSQVDLMATIAALVGVALPERAAVDSYDLTPLVRGENPQPPIRDTHVHNTFEEHYALRQGDYVLVDAPSGAVSKVPEWFDERYGYTPNPHEHALYNLRDDVAQRNNLAAELPQKTKELKGMLEHLKRHGHRANTP